MNVVRLLLLLLLLPTLDPANATTHTALTVELAWLRANSARQDVVVVDTRDSHEFATAHIAGAVSIPVAATLGKGERSDLFASISARNVPAAELIAGAGPKMRPLYELADRFGEIANNKQVITYCTEGKHAAMACFTLRSLGYDVAAYDGSWYEWGYDFDLPIARER